MSLYGAIVDLYDDSDDADVVALRTAAGQDKLWTGRPPAETDIPYVSVTSVSVTPQSQSKNNASRIDEWVVQFSVFDDSLQDVEDLLDKLEAAYLRSALTVTGRSLLSGHPRFQSRGTLEEEEIKGLWHGYLEIIWLVRKSPV